MKFKFPFKKHKKDSSENWTKQVNVDHKDFKDPDGKELTVSQIIKGYEIFRKNDDVNNIYSEVKENFDKIETTFNDIYNDLEDIDITLIKDKKLKKKLSKLGGQKALLNFFLEKIETNPQKQTNKESDISKTKRTIEESTILKKLNLDLNELDEPSEEDLTNEKQSPKIISDTSEEIIKKEEMDFVTQQSEIPHVVKDKSKTKEIMNNKTQPDLEFITFEKPVALTVETNLHLKEISKKEAEVQIAKSANENKKTKV